MPFAPDDPNSESYTGAGDGSDPGTGLGNTPQIPWVQVPGSDFGFNANDPQLQQWHYPIGKTQSKQMVRLSPTTGQWEYQDNPDYAAAAGPTPDPETKTTPTGGGGGGGGTPAAGPAAGPAANPFPTFTAPGFTPSTPLQAPANPYRFTPFEARTFTAPTLEEAKNNPGYQFGLKQGQDSFLNNRALLGTIRGGGTIKDLFNYTNAAAEQNYGNVFNQNKSIFDTNEGERFGAWSANQLGGLNEFNTNYGVTKDVNSSLNAGNQQDYTNSFNNASAEFNPKFQGATLSFADQYNRWLAKLNSLTTIASAGAQ